MADVEIAMTIAQAADLSAPLVSSDMCAHASKPVIVNWLMSIPTKKRYLQKHNRVWDEAWQHSCVHC